jgi:hypothetical protein
VPPAACPIHAKCMSLLCDRNQKRDMSTNLKPYYNLSSWIFGEKISIRIVWWLWSEWPRGLRLGSAAARLLRYIGYM